MKKLDGVVAPILTPYDADKDIDYRVVNRLTEFYIEKGVHGLYPCGTTGETCLLTVPERKQILETVLAAADGRIAVFAHVGTLSRRDTLELALHACQVGADGIGIITPPFYKLSDEAIFQYYDSIISELPVDFPVYLYAIPQNCVNDLTPELVLRLAEKHANICGIKYSYPNLQRLNAYIALLEDFSVLIGPEDLFFVALTTGAAGVVSGNANVIPESFVEIYEAFKKKDYVRARATQRKTAKQCDVLNNYGGISAYKYALKYRGFDCGGVRSPLLDLNTQQEKDLLQALNALDFPFHR